MFWNRDRVCRHYNKRSVWKNSVVTGVPLVIKKVCDDCGWEETTGAGYQQEEFERQTPEGYKWRPSKTEPRFELYKDQKEFNHTLDEY